MIQRLLPAIIVIGFVYLFGSIALGRRLGVVRIVAVLALLAVLAAPALGRQLVDVMGEFGGEVVRTARGEQPDPETHVDGIIYRQGETTGIWAVTIDQVRVTCADDALTLSVKGGDSLPVEYRHSEPITLRLGTMIDVPSEPGTGDIWRPWLLDGHRWVIPAGTYGAATIFLPGLEIAANGEPVHTDPAEVPITITPPQCEPTPPKPPPEDV